MIEKLSEYEITSRDGSFINVECNTKIINTLVRKINELVDSFNDITDWIKRTDETIVKYGIKPIPEKIAQGFKNLQEPYVEQCNCPEQMGYIKLDSDSLAVFLKTHPQYNKNGMLNLSSCSVKLQDELERTRKALEIAINAIDEILYLDSGKFIQEPAEMWKIAKSAKDKIIALEQKENQ